MSQAEDDPPLPAAEEAALLATLEAALRPGELDAALNERLIELALEDPLAPPSADELAESERLRQALEGGAEHDDLRLLSALRSAAAPSDDDAAVERALRAATTEERRSGKVVYAVFGAASVVVAAAAALLLFIGPSREPAPSATSLAADYAKPRSTAPLFSDRFETRDTTARVDLIASARARELRDNRYTAWGVR